MRLGRSVREIGRHTANDQKSRKGRRSSVVLGLGGLGPIDVGAHGGLEVQIALKRTDIYRRRKVKMKRNVAVRAKAATLKFRRNWSNMRKGERKKKRSCRVPLVFGLLAVRGGS
jgi:hypothetical protein